MIDIALGLVRTSSSHMPDSAIYVQRQEVQSFVIQLPKDNDQVPDLGVPDGIELLGAVILGYFLFLFAWNAVFEPARCRSSPRSSAAILPTVC